MENQKFEYTNGFAITVNNETGELCLALLRTVPSFDIPDDASNGPTSIESIVELVNNVVMPLNVAKQLNDALSEQIRQSETQKTEEK